MRVLKPGPRENAAIPSEKPAGATEGAAERALILLVEDQPDNQSLVQEYLEWKGYRVAVANSGEECLSLLGRMRPALVLMDMKMPGIDGFETTRRLRAMPGFETLPIVALTAHGMKKDAARCLEAGCTAHLAKPFEPEALLKIVEQYLGRPAT